VATHHGYLNEIGFCSPIYSSHYRPRDGLPLRVGLDIENLTFDYVQFFHSFLSRIILILGPLRRVSDNIAVNILQRFFISNNVVVIPSLPTKIHISYSTNRFVHADLYWLIAAPNTPSLQDRFVETPCRGVSINVNGLSLIAMIIWI
jgi:hypothetical protein